ncbi:proton-coupled folate transporter-like [Penaeus chinensis]|uniref:proton-coupled folate transporter-like n=1 Tax=Penaeus chinensis TaxID=139456 RepID=UPI001FB86135|nr:proton-coupled folate transporter-like [Penaeus chinensis]
MDTSPEIEINPSLGKEEEIDKDGVHREAKGDGGTAISTMKKLWAATTYEPLLLLHAIVHFGTIAMTESLIAEKSCLVTLSKPEDICKELYNHPDDEIEVQQVASRYQGSATLAENLVAMFLLLYIGPFSDRYGRKPFLYLSLVTKTLNILILFFASVFIYSPTELTVVAPFLYSLGGAMGSFQMLVFACISDVTTEANRTYRLGILKIFIAFGSPTGRVVSGQMYAAGGYVAVYGLALGLLAICLLMLVFTAESVKFSDNEERPKFKVSWLVEVPAELLTAVHRKEGPRRGIVYAILFSHICIFFAMNPLYFLFFKLMFDWDATDYSNWLFYRDMTKAIALVLLMPVLVGRLQLPDTALGLLGCSSVAFMQIALGQIVSASMTWVTLLGPLLGMLELFAHLASRSIMSKCSDGSRELGKLFAAQAVLDSIATGFAGPLYAAVYSSSVDSLPMAQFLLAALFMFLAVLGISVCDIFLLKKEDRQEKA